MATGFSQRRAARTLDLSRSCFRYKRRVKLDGVDERIVQLAQANPRYGHRRIWALLRRLQVRRRSKKRIRTGHSVPMKAGYPS
jgi:hypothetical protein